MKIIGVYNLPNTITFLGLVLAVSACFFSFHTQFELALIALMYAGLCDLFDGLLARKLSLDQQARDFGHQLDAIVDMASFGVAPVVIALHGGLSGWPDAVLLIFYTLCAAMRLAWFNVYGTEAAGPMRYYTGLPVTYAALVIPVIYAFQRLLNMNTHVILQMTFLILALLFILKIPIPKPRGVFYILFPLLAIGLTIFWLGQYFQAH